eukprot:m.32095 g.32095  ORF g.32095 m.32095 type:complete len:57 (+) comp31596_c0_seq4:274-444(+)
MLNARYTAQLKVDNSHVIENFVSRRSPEVKAMEHADNLYEETFYETVDSLTMAVIS